MSIRYPISTTTLKRARQALRGLSEATKAMPKQTDDMACYVRKHETAIREISKELRARRQVIAL